MATLCQSASHEFPCPLNHCWEVAQLRARHGRNPGDSCFSGCQTGSRPFRHEAETRFILYPSLCSACGIAQVFLHHVPSGSRCEDGPSRTTSVHKRGIMHVRPASRALDLGLITKSVSVGCKTKVFSQQ